VDRGYVLFLFLEAPASGAHDPRDRVELIPHAEDLQSVEGRTVSQRLQGCLYLRGQLVEGPVGEAAAELSSESRCLLVAPDSVGEIGKKNVRCEQGPTSAGRGRLGCLTAGDQLDESLGLLGADLDAGGVRPDPRRQLCSAQCARGLHVAKVHRFGETRGQFDLGTADRDWCSPHGHGRRPLHQESIERQHGRSGHVSHGVSDRVGVLGIGSLTLSAGLLRERSCHPRLVSGSRHWWLPGAPELDRRIVGSRKYDVSAVG
jgi:hypothetical protein